MNKWVSRGVMLVLLAGAGVGGVVAYKRATRPAEYTFRTAKVDRGNITARVTATGTLVGARDGAGRLAGVGAAVARSTSTSTRR